MNFAAKLNCVFTAVVGNVIHELKAIIGALNLGPVKSAQFLRENIKRENVDAGESEIERCGYARVESVSRRRFVVVGGERGLVKAVVAKARLIDPLRAWS